MPLVAFATGPRAGTSEDDPAARAGDVWFEMRLATIEVPLIGGTSGRKAAETVIDEYRVEPGRGAVLLAVHVGEVTPARVVEAMPHRFALGASGQLVALVTDLPPSLRSV